MKGTIILKIFIAIFFMVFIPEFLLANSNKPVPLCNIKFDHSMINQIQADTLPSPPEQNTANTKSQPTTDIIKVVPKAHRQPLPVPVTIKVKPVKIIKPKIKIIKPVIKILH